MKILYKICWAKIYIILSPRFLILSLNLCNFKYTIYSMKFLLNVIGTKRESCGWNTVSTLVSFKLFVNIASSQSYGNSLLPLLKIHLSRIQQPIIYTFVYYENLVSLFEKDDYIRLWAEAWANAG